MTVTDMPALPELRSTLVAPLDHVEFRESGNGTDMVLEGHAAVFNQWSDDLFTWAGVFRERVAPGAFRDVLASKPDVRALFNHDANFVLGRTHAGTLDLQEDATGLRVWARVAPTQWAADLRTSMQRGDIDQMSFAFTVAEDEWHEDHDQEIVERTVLRVGELFDVSVVTYPAYPQTDAALRELRAAADAGRIHPAAHDDRAGIEHPAAADDPPGSPLRVARLKARARASTALHT
jgi:HK97 family phage prohead protease